VLSCTAAGGWAVTSTDTRPHGNSSPGLAQLAAGSAGPAAGTLGPQHPALTAATGQISMSIDKHAPAPPAAKDRTGRSVWPIHRPGRRCRDGTGL